MFRSSAPKRTGVYRVCGNMADFQMELRLRHISEWLPVPKFEYTGANATAQHGDHYPESPLSSSFGDFFIYVPHDDHNGNYCNYYDYYNPSSEYGKAAVAVAVNRSYTSRDSYASRSSTTATPTATGSTETRSVTSGEHFEQAPTTTMPRDEDFMAINRELCNGATASLSIGWQQKHFSRAELQRYGDAGQCVTTLQRRYHRWCKQTAELQLRYDEQVAYHQQTYADQLQLRRRRGRGRSKRNAEAPLLPDDPNFAARTCLIHTLIDADLRESGEAGGDQLMRIYAQLQRDTLLFSLRYSPTDGLLYVYPDFNLSADDMEYSLEIDNDCRQLFAYGLENVTPSPSPPLLQRCKQPAKPASEQLLLPPAAASATQLLSHYEQQRHLAAERRRLLQFVAPPKRMRRVALLLELRQAQDFEHDNIHIRYYVNLPPHTLLEPEQPDEPFPLRGATATCHAGSSSAGRVARFSHCWQLTLLCEEEFRSSADQLLHIYFEVISIDGWQRERCEGYAHFAWPLLAPLPHAVVAGIRLQCSRPLGSWLDALNRYFIGGRKLFDFVRYFGSHATALHSRLEPDAACGMRTTGHIVFSMRKLQQRQPPPLGHQLLLPNDSHSHDDDDDADDDEDDEDDEDSHSRSRKSGSSTLDEVLAAYVEARDRIEALLGHATEL
ncbi:hypothetical protein KR044_011600 [Drosophila immigrans]|nr:hypothetical protein KR044_011600 [Drosophila immigrans]